jgi:protein-tyrosine phosphatase
VISLVDIHCHVLAGLDDGPASMAEAIEMCRIARQEGTGVIAATAHLGEQWPDVTPDRIRSATRQLRSRLEEIGLPLIVYPGAEIVVRPDLEEAFARGQLVGVADGRMYLLLELPAGSFLDLRDLVRRLRGLGIRPILAHPERNPELLHEAGLVEALIRLGCLIQVSAHNISHPASRKDAAALKRWVRRGIVHLMGSDGHSPDRRPPRMAQAYHRIARWAGPHAADRICCINGLKVCEGSPLRPPEPRARKRRWFSWFR